MPQDGEAGRAQSAGAFRREQGVGEDPAGQGDGVQAVPLARVCAERGDEGGDGVVEPGGDQCRVRAGAYVGHHGGEHGRRIGGDRPAVGVGRLAEAEGVAGSGVGFGRTQGGALQLDRGLRLVAGQVADAGQGGDGVEEAAHAGGRDAVQPAFQLPLQQLDLPRRAGGHAGQVRAPVDARGP